MRYGAPYLTLYSLYCTTCKIHHTPYYTIHYISYTTHHAPYSIHHTPYTLYHTSHQVNKLEGLDKSAPEYNITRTYLDWLHSIPWGVYTSTHIDLQNAR
ncbi:hypothetical protein EON63_08360 [archaeon]|nr:MAG: hypothetical protein EON63_08360 [archaeon]